MPVGQHDDHHKGGVLGDERGDADGSQRSDPPRHTRREAQRGPQPQPEPQRRAKCGDHEGGDACRGAHREHQFGRQGQAGEAATVPGGERDEDKVSADHHDAGHDRGQRRGGEPAVRLQDAVEDHGQAVEQDLRGEHHQHVRTDGDHGRLRAVRHTAEQQRGKRVRGERDYQAGGGQQDDRPGQQRRGDLGYLGVGAEAGTAGHGTPLGRSCLGC